MYYKFSIIFKTNTSKFKLPVRIYCTVVVNYTDLLLYEHFGSHILIVYQGNNNREFEK